MAKVREVRRIDSSSMFLLSTLLGLLAYASSEFNHMTPAYLLGCCSFILVCYVCLKSFWSYGNNANNVCFIVVENRLSSSEVIVEWGRARDNSFVYSNMTPLDPNRAVSRYLESKRPPATNMDRPCIRVSHYAGGERESITVILWELDERCHTKVYEITDNGIT